MKQLLTVGVRARFSLHQINDMWSEFRRLFDEQPWQDLFQVGEHRDWRKPSSDEVWVKIDDYPDGKVAIMRLSNEF